jgi:curved DNA-binding protein CbpA
MDIDKCFEILKVSPDSSPSALKQVYRDLVNVWHPDRFPNNDRLRKKAEEELKRINQAYEDIQQFLSSRQEPPRLRAEEEEGVKREAETRAKQQADMASAKADAEAQRRQKTKAEFNSDTDWEHRTLCGDGSCIGILNKAGRCKECGRTLEEAKKDAKTKVHEEKEKTKPDDEAKPIDWENRTLCSDGTCIGIIGSNGRCTECGKQLGEKRT